MKKETIIKNIEKLKARLAKDRDDLRDAYDELEQLLGAADDTVKLLEEAIDKMSEIV